MSKSLESQGGLFNIHACSDEQDLNQMDALSSDNNIKSGHTINATSFQLFSKANLHGRNTETRPTTAAAQSRTRKVVASRNAGKPSRFTTVQ
mmetsp:Transcript_4989/g.6652  ORF Transcript_4989/g.6652 Transcript_4989/m.6652 type:complete len:92 (-) Transcript_4989:1513-1788(-)